MNELLVIAWLLLPASALLIQYYLIQKRQNLLWILPLLSLAVTFFIGLGGCIVCFFPDYIYKGSDGRRSASKLMTSLVFISRIYSWETIQRRFL